MKKLKKIILNVLLYTIFGRNVDKLHSLRHYDSYNVKLRKEKKMEIRDYLKDELKRLNRMNDLLEKQTNKGNTINNEPERIVNNVKAMCQIANTIHVCNVMK